MKNIFKSLMFVAVAAMTFTACEKDNAENNNNNGTEQKTTITFNAKMADTDTRTYFGAYDEENEYYPTLLNGDEAVRFNHWNKDYNGNASDKTYNIVNGYFTIDDLTITSGATMDAYLPASAWGNPVVKWNDTTWKAEDVTREYTIPEVQEPSKTNIDPAAHIFKATTTYNGKKNVDLYFEHQVAYGKFSLKNFAEGVTPQSYTLKINGTEYNINAQWTENIWFACKPVEEVTDMVIFVITENGNYVKSLNISAEKGLSFVKGQVSQFGINMQDVNIGEATALSTPVFENVSAYANSITATWNSVSDAQNYTVTLHKGEEVVATETTTALTKEFTGLDYNTEYTVTVVANPENTDLYKSSEPASKTVSTEEEGNNVILNPWKCEMTDLVSGGSYGIYNITVVGTGENTDTIILKGVKYNTDSEITAIRDGVEGSGTGKINGSFLLEFNVTIGNVTYIGTSDNSYLDFI